MLSISRITESKCLWPVSSSVAPKDQMTQNVNHFYRRFQYVSALLGNVKPIDLASTWTKTFINLVNDNTIWESRTGTISLRYSFIAFFLANSLGNHF